MKNLVERLLNLKTTISGLVVGVVSLLLVFNVDISQHSETIIEVVGAVLSGLVVILGALAKD